MERDGRPVQAEEKCLLGKRYRVVEFIRIEVGLVLLRSFLLHVLVRRFRGLLFIFLVFLFFLSLLFNYLLLFKFLFLIDYFHRYIFLNILLRLYEIVSESRRLFLKTVLDLEVKHDHHVRVVFVEAWASVVALLFFASIQH